MVIVNVHEVAQLVVLPNDPIAAGAEPVVGDTDDRVVFETPGRL